MTAVYLRVKAKALAEEARIIRREEEKALRGARWWAKEHEDGIDQAPDYRLYAGLRRERVGYLRREARATQLARAFLNGKRYREIEPTARTEPDVWRIDSTISTWGGEGIKHYRAFTDEDCHALDAWAAEPMVLAQRPVRESVPFVMPVPEPVEWTEKRKMRAIRAGRASE